MSCRSPPPFMLFMTRCICRSCFSSRFTSCTCTPEPPAMRRRREPPMIAGLRRSRGVMELMMAVCRRRSRSPWSADTAPVLPAAPGRVSRVLARHRVHHDPALAAAYPGPGAAHFGHERLTHVEPRGGGHDQGSEHTAVGALGGRARNRYGGLGAEGAEVLGLD